MMYGLRLLALLSLFALSSIPFATATDSGENDVQVTDSDSSENEEDSGSDDDEEDTQETEEDAKD